MKTALTDRVNQIIRAWQKDVPQKAEDSRAEGDQIADYQISQPELRSRTAGHYSLLELHKAIDLAG